MKKKKKKAKLRFLGGAGTVTGSKILVESKGKRILVDCGMFQGIKALREKNWEDFPVEPSSIDAILLTHAHLDHCGYIPALVAKGFKGEIHCTPPTKDLTEVILSDSAKIQEEEAERANRYKYTKHKPAKPLYTLVDVEFAMGLFITHNLHQWVILNGGMKFQFRNSGHLPGSAFIEMKINKKVFVFSGDLGRTKPLILPSPEYIKYADVVVMESTYGDRLHTEEDPQKVLGDIIWETYRRKGILMIPTFTVERAQELLFLLANLKEQNELPGIQIFLDSPMGVQATNILLKHSDWHSLSKEECLAMNSIAELIVDAKASRAVVADSAPKIVLAGSGMITGGRILHYLSQFGDDPNNTILLAGFQAAGTRGRTLLEGANELKFFGTTHKINAQIKQMHSLSGHGDQQDILNWLSHLKNKPEQILLNHGEPHQSNALRVKIQDDLGFPCRTVQMDQRISFKVEEELVREDML